MGTSMCAGASKELVPGLGVEGGLSLPGREVVCALRR